MPRSTRTFAEQVLAVQRGEKRGDEVPSVVRDAAANLSEKEVKELRYDKPMNDLQRYG